MTVSPSSSGPGRDDFVFLPSGFVSRFTLGFFKFQVSKPTSLKKKKTSPLRKQTPVFSFQSMAVNNKLKTLESRIINQRAESELEPESEDDLQELESDVRKMTEKILEYRSAIPDQLKTTLASILSTHRPNLPGVNGGSEAGPSGENNADSEEMELDKERRRTEEKIRSLKGKISSSISAVPVIVKRLKACISRIEKLDSCNGIIHPAFKKKIG